MTKKLNVEAIANELKESAFFRRPEQEQPETNTPAALPQTPIHTPEQTTTEHDT